MVMANRMNRLMIYKLIFSLLLGFLSFLGIYASLKIDFNGTSVNFALSLILPMLVALSFGPGYAIFSITAGLAVFYPFILGPYNGWASLVPSASLILWVGLQGWGSMKRRREKAFWNSMYFLQGLYVLMKFLLYIMLFQFLLTFNPPFWYPLAYRWVGMDVILLFAVKGVLVDTVLLALADAILLLPLVRRFFLLPVSKASRYNSPILLGLVLFGTVFTLLILYVNNVIIGGASQLEWLLDPDQGTVVTLSLSVLLFGVMGGIAVRFFQRNQEARIALERKNRQIRSMNLQLEKRVEARTQELRAAVAELQEFSFGVSHDLKSPVRAVEAYTQMLMEDLPEIPDESRKMLASVYGLCGRMTGLIEKILEYSTISRRKPVFEQVPLIPILKELKDEFIMANPDRHLNISISSEEEGLALWGDRILLQDLFANLLSNSVKFSKNADPADISISLGKGEAGIQVVIRDNGAGFDMRHQEKLFSLFQRLHSQEEFQGSGIGLVMVRKILQIHKGEIRLESEAGKGTTATLLFPGRGEQNV